MKPHIRIVFRQPLENGGKPFPDWMSVIQLGRSAPSQIEPSVDRLMRAHGVEFKATHEFSPAERDWSRDEINAGLNRVYRLILMRNHNIPQALIREIRLIPSVVSAEPIQLVRVPLNPNPPSAISASFSRNTNQDSRDLIFLADAHRYTQGHSSVTVAVLDTGVHVSHRELVHAMRPGMDFVNIIDGAQDFIGDYLQADQDPDDDVGHGTHVAGIIAARGLAMPKGVVPRCKILPVRVLAAMKQQGEPVGAGLIENIDSGIKWAVDQGADVINMSLGVLHEGGGLPHKAVVDYAKRKGVTIVAASGNDGQENRYYPGAFPHVIAVGASNPTRHVSSFSSYGHHVSCVAPGENIYSTHIDQGYKFLTGTSHASPFVAGAVAMLKSFAKERGRSLSDGQVKFILKNTCDKFGTQFKDRKSGYGQLNLIDALALLKHKIARPSQSLNWLSQENYHTERKPMARNIVHNQFTNERIETAKGDCHV